MNISTNSNMYKAFAAYYDKFYQTKNYEKECNFLQKALSKFNIKTILDVGCGTGSHLLMLEKNGYLCDGIDFNSNMLEIARQKVHGNVFQGDMRNFELKKLYNAITSLFAVFNHNLSLEDAKKTLLSMKSHLNKDGILILDLYNPQSSGKKINTVDEITKVMEWNLCDSNKICHSKVSFFKNSEKLYEENFPLKIFSILEMQHLLKEAGFNKIDVYNGFEFELGDSLSKNLVFIAH